MKPAEELFHLSEDPLEMVNLAKNPEYAAQLKEMRKAYDTEVTDWKNNSVDYNNYSQYGVIFDRTVSWDKKAKLYSGPARNTYKKEHEKEKSGVRKK